MLANLASITTIVAFNMAFSSIITSSSLFNAYSLSSSLTSSTVRHSLIIVVIDSLLTYDNFSSESNHSLPINI